MGADGFEIEITKQGWLGQDDPSLDYDPATVDLCSHGGIRLTIGGQEIAAGTKDEEFGISESALALLRTLESDHSPESPVAERLIFHGCGTILMMGCYVGIDWTVLHLDGSVRISGVTYDGDPSRFRGLVAEVPEAEYHRQVLAFAQRAKEPFEGVTKEFEGSSQDGDFDRQQYEEFWTEYEARLSRAKRRPDR